MNWWGTTSHIWHIPHRTKFHYTLSTSHHMMCDLAVLNVKCGMVGCAWNWRGSAWNIELGWWDVGNVLTHWPLHLAPHHIRNHHILHRIPHQTPTVWQNSKPNHIPRHTIIPHHITFHITPLSLVRHLSQHTIPLCNTIFQILTYRPHYGSHHWPLGIAPHLTLLTYHIMPHSDHTILATFMHRTTFCTTLHRISYAPHLASFHHIWLWSHQIPHPTPFHITSHISIPPLSTSHHLLCHIRMTSPPPTTYRAVSQPTLYLIPHRTTFHIPCHRTRTNPYYTTTFHNPIPVWETRTRAICDPFCYVLSFTYNQLYHIKPNTKTWWWKSATLFIKCQKK